MKFSITTIKSKGINYELLNFDRTCNLNPLRKNKTGTFIKFLSYKRTHYVQWLINKYFINHLLRLRNYYFHSDLDRSVKDSLKTIHAVKIRGYKTNNRYFKGYKKT